MNAGRQSTWLAAAGLVLIALGLLCWWSGLDVPLHHVLRLAGTATPHLVRFTALGGLLVLGPLALLALAVLLWSRRVRDALWLALTIVSGRLAVEGLKALIERPRPPRIDWLEIVKSWSFPSAHSANTMITCVAVALLFGGDRRSLAAALLAALLIGWSRVALAVHWPSDVLAGWGCGLLWLGLAMRFRRPGNPVPEPCRG